MGHFEQVDGRPAGTNGAYGLLRCAGYVTGEEEVPAARRHIYDDAVRVGITGEVFRVQDLRLGAPERKLSSCTDRFQRTSSAAHVRQQAPPGGSSAAAAVYDRPRRVVGDDGPKAVDVVGVRVRDQQAVEPRGPGLSERGLDARSAPRRPSIDQACPAGRAKHDRIALADVHENDPQDDGSAGGSGLRTIIDELPCER